MICLPTPDEMHTFCIGVIGVEEQERVGLGYGKARVRSTLIMLRARRDYEYARRLWPLQGSGAIMRSHAGLIIRH